MRKWFFCLLALVLLGLLSRLPHSARDVAKLDPVRVVWISEEAGKIIVETDTGDSGTGMDLSEAAAALKQNADGEIFLETAEFLILDPSVPVTEELFVLLRPDCGVFFSVEQPDMENVADYLSIHKPQRTLAHLRASIVY